MSNDRRISITVTFIRDDVDELNSHFDRKNKCIFRLFLLRAKAEIKGAKKGGKSLERENEKLKQNKNSPSTLPFLFYSFSLRNSCQTK